MCLLASPNMPVLSCKSLWLDHCHISGQVFAFSTVGWCQSIPSHNKCYHLSILLHGYWLRFFCLEWLLYASIPSATNLSFKPLLTAAPIFSRSAMFDNDCCEPNQLCIFAPLFNSQLKLCVFYQHVSTCNW